MADPKDTNEKDMASTAAPSKINASKEPDETPKPDIESGTNSESTQDATNGKLGEEISGDREISPPTANNEIESTEDHPPREGNPKMQSMEIDVNADEGNETDESFEEDGDMQHLLRNDDGTEKSPQKETYPLCSLKKGPGNMSIFLPRTFYKTGWGIAGPHWFGPICVLGLILLASHYFIGISYRRIGPVTTVFCILFTTACAYNLANVAYRDPGVVKLQPNTLRPEDADEDQRLQYRWCDRCQVFQPVDGAHCSDCNVCIAGFDHHCVWMGTCIGKNNFKQFVKFNITWLLYLMFSVTWVSVLGPLIFGHKHKHSDVLDSHSDDGPNRTMF